MTKLTLAILMAFATAGAANASNYLVVVPAPTASNNPIQVTLTGSALPGTSVGKLYTVDLNPMLTVVGDPHFDSSKVVWTLLQGPIGLSVVDGTLRGSLAEPGSHLVRVGATYKNKAGKQEYQVIAAEVTVTLTSVAAPEGNISLAYSLDLTQGLLVTGDQDYASGLESWELSSGSLPGGLSLDNGVVSGTPDAVGKFSSTITASYLRKQATTPLNIDVYASLTQREGYRAWSDGTYAESCNAYLKGGSHYRYAGATGDGIYRIKLTAEAPFDVFCDMSTDGGGWTLVMKQAKGDGATLQGDTSYWTAGTRLNDDASNLNRSDTNLVSNAFSKLIVTDYRLEASNEVTRKFEVRAASTPLAAFSNAQRADYSDDAGEEPLYPDWFIHTTTFPNGQDITTSRFGFNFMEINIRNKVSACGARWGWAANQDLQGNSIGSHDACGGMGAYGAMYGGNYMNNDKNVWQPATLYLWAR